MKRFYSVLARVVTIYAFLHPFAYLGAQWWEIHRAESEAMAGWTDESDTIEDDAGTIFEARSGDGTPLLYQHLYWESVFSVRNVLLAVVMGIGLLGVGAIFHIAARVSELADANTK